jgi:hypothetical protein
MAQTVAAATDIAVQTSPVSAVSERRNGRHRFCRNVGPVDIRIGIANTPRELSFETSQTSAEIESIVSSALETGSPLIRISDDKGKVYIVPTATFAYIEVGSEVSHRVGFVA